MAVWITDVTIERHTLTVQAPGSLSPSRCASAPTECCVGTHDETGGASGPGCCPDADLAPFIEAVVQGALKQDGSAGLAIFDLERSGDGVEYEGVDRTGVAGTLVGLNVWCVVDEDGTVLWFAALTLTWGESVYGATNIRLNDDGTLLTAEYTRADYPDNPITISVAKPCGTVTPCVSLCETPGSLTNVAHNYGGLPVTLTYLGLVGGWHVWNELEIGENLWLKVWFDGCWNYSYRNAGGVFETGRTCACTFPITIPNPEPLTGAVVLNNDPCPILTACCPTEGTASTITLTVTGTGCAGTYEMAYDSASQSWKLTGTFGSCNFTDTEIELYCAGGTWELGFFGRAVTVIATSTSPTLLFESTAAATGLDTCGCSGDMTFSAPSCT